MAITKKMLDAFTAPLTLDQIQFQVNFQGKTKKAGQLKVLCYIDSRVVQDRLNECFGVGNYQIFLRPVKIANEDGLMCTLKLKVLDESDGTSEWITLEAISEVSQVSPLKGGASGALKKVVGLIGLYRELYSMPHLYVETNETSTIPEWAYPKLKSIVQDFLEGKNDKFVHYIKQDQSLLAQSSNNTSPAQPSITPKGSFTPPTKPSFGK